MGGVEAAKTWPNAPAGSADDTKTLALIELLAALERRVAERIEVQKAEIAELKEENAYLRSSLACAAVEASS